MKAIKSIRNFIELLITIILIFNINYSKAQSSNKFKKYIDENGWYDLTNSSFKINVDSIFILFKDQFGLLGSDSMKIDLIETDKKDKSNKKIIYQQYYKGYKVEDAQFIVQGKNGIVKRMHGKLIPSLNLDVSNPISEKEALTKALNFINANEYAWKNEEYENGLRLGTNNPLATWYPKGELLISILNSNTSGSVIQTGKTNSTYTESTNAVFVYKFNVLSTEPLQQVEIEVDANDGEIITSSCGQPSGVEYSAPTINFSEFTYQHDLSDDFNGPVLNSNIWMHDLGHSCFPLHKVPDKSLSQLSNISYLSVPDGSSSGTSSVIRIVAKKEQNPITYTCPWWQCECPPPYLRDFNYTSSSVISKDPYLYGYYEIRSRFPNIKREVSQDFWFWSGWCGLDYPQINRYSEIDVFEHFSSKANDPDANNRYPINFHAGPCLGACIDSINSSSYNTNMCKDLSLDFHTYGILWTPNYVEFYFDNTPLHDDNHPNTIYPIHLVTESCSGSGSYRPVSELKAMNLIIGQAVRGGTLDPPRAGDLLNFDIDYIKYYKKKPEILGPGNICTGNQQSYTASMFNNTNTTDVFTWSVSGGAIIVGSNTGSSVQILATSGPSFTINLTATESTTGYYNYNGSGNAPGPGYYNYSIPRISTRSRTISTTLPGLPSLTLGQIGFTCEKEVIASEQSGTDAYYFSEDNGSTWVIGTRKQVVYNGNVFYYWGFGDYYSGSFTVSAKAHNCTGYSSVTTKTFNYGTPPSGCLWRLARLNENDNIISNFQVYPNITSSTTTFQYSIVENNSISLSIYNLYGKEIDRLIDNQPQDTGVYKVDFDVSKLPNGLYLCALKEGNKIYYEKLIVMK